jgi:Ion channel
MAIISAMASIGLLVLVLIDGFETMVLPRRITRRFRLTRLVYRTMWFPWRVFALWLRPGKTRENFLSIFGPMSILLLFACWMAGLTIGFAWLHWSLATALNTRQGAANLATYLYMSGTTIFTLGFGDVVPVGRVGQFLAVIEAGTGFGFMAVVIGYLPVLYQAFSRRESIISMLDARAGSPPSGGQLLLRAVRSRDIDAARQFLKELEQWSAEVLESHLSFPVLVYYRSQHDNQSWLAALATALDACAILMAKLQESPYQAQLTFAMARHVTVDLALVFHVPPRTDGGDRFPAEAVALLRTELTKAGVALNDEEAANRKLAELRAMYEPFLVALGDHFLINVPALCSATDTVDNWQTSAWTRRTVGIGKLAALGPKDDHFA